MPPTIDLNCVVRDRRIFPVPKIPLLILLEASVSGQDPFSWTSTGIDKEVELIFKNKGDRNQLWSFPRTNGTGPIRLKYNAKYVITAKDVNDEGDITLKQYNGDASQI
ncbi:hypothetical protein [Burkholderia humptydooensis]|uniref:hypothetical protein n=1 Tax=Burkholderia humptydooensis TaxID=430531 RepID=UPI0010FF3B59|nr:hypothetical protein [Burkholderia humptydooensis]